MTDFFAGLGLSVVLVDLREDKPHGERSNAIADLIHEVAFFFLSTARFKTSLTEPMLLMSVSDVLRGLIFVSD